MALATNVAREKNKRETSKSTAFEITPAVSTTYAAISFKGLASDVAWLLGLWVGDGGSTKAEIATHREEITIHDRIVHVANLFGLDVTMKPKKSDANTLTEKRPKPNLGSDHFLYSRTCRGTGSRRNQNQKNPFWDLVTFFEMDGKGNEHVPLFLATETIEVIEQFLAGLIDSDGHVRESSNTVSNKTSYVHVTSATKASRVQ